MRRTESIWFAHQAPGDWRPEYPECSMYEYMRRTAVKTPALNALWFEGKAVSFAQLLHHIDITFDALQAQGIKKGDIVSIMLPNMPQAVYLFYALNRLGAVANMIHPLLSRNEIKDSVESTNSILLFALDSLFEKIHTADWPNRPKTILVNVADALPFFKKAVYPLVAKSSPIHFSPFALSWKQFLSTRSGSARPSDVGTGDDLAALTSSGGTTGKSKSVMLTNRSFNAIAIQAYETMGIPNIAGMKVLALFPIFHPSGLGICIHTMLCHGICVYLIPTFDFKKCFRVIFKNKVELLFGVPAFYEALLRSEEVDKHRCDFLRLLGCAGDYLPDRLRSRVNQRMLKDGNPTTMTNGYGLTECGGCCCVDPYFLKKAGTSGLIAPDMKCKIVEPGTQHALAAGEVGELCISGPTIMKGYFNDPQATDRALRLHEDGLVWLHTGDAFSLDPDGYLCFKQRLDRMFVVAGYNIYPPRIEEVISGIADVRSCCVVGVDDRVSGKKTVAYIVPAPNADESSLREQISTVCKNNIPQYAYPSNVIFLDEFPRTKLGKVDYKKLEKRNIL